MSERHLPGSSIDTCLACPFFGRDGLCLKNRRVMTSGEAKAIDEGGGYRMGQMDPKIASTIPSWCPLPRPHEASLPQMLTSLIMDHGEFQQATRTYVIRVADSKLEEILGHDMMQALQARERNLIEAGKILGKNKGYTP